jgi:uncharacterized membrane protein
LETGIESDVQRTIPSRLRVAGMFLIAGLIVELLSLFWTHPLAFMAFIAVGCVLMGIGIVIFLWMLLSASRSGV